VSGNTVVTGNTVTVTSPSVSDDNALSVISSSATYAGALITGSVDTATSAATANLLLLQKGTSDVFRVCHPPILSLAACVGVPLGSGVLNGRSGLGHCARCGGDDAASYGYGGCFSGLQVTAAGSTYAAGSLTATGTGVDVTNGFAVLDTGLVVTGDTLTVAQTSGSATGKVLNVQSSANTYAGDLIVAEVPDTAVGTAELLRLKSAGVNRFQVKGCGPLWREWVWESACGV
jgi:hypothetical protein